VARCFVDVDVAVAIGRLLEAGGHEAEFARDLGLGKARRREEGGAWRSS
jgi:hypothetical protein